jgi:hypothetical protein
MLTMTEEGLPYQVTIRRLTAEEFDIAIANPGGRDQAGSGQCISPAGVDRRPFCLQ